MSEPASTPVIPATGQGVLHLFCKPTPLYDQEAFVAAIRDWETGDTDDETRRQAITVAVLGHKCDVAVMAITRDLRALRALQTAVQRAGLDVVDSYVSLTEVSEYAAGMPEAMLHARIYPDLPPRNLEATAWCFYPMSKRRGDKDNWYTLPFEDRDRLMREHGTSGRKFHGRIVQLITGSTGIDDFEWGVTLFAAKPDDLKAVVYTLRYDEASALFAEFGTFYTGLLTPVEELAGQIG